MKSFIQHINNRTSVKLLKRYYKQLKFYQFLNSSSVAQSKDLLKANREHTDIDIITVAFNNYRLLEHQVTLLRKHLKDRFTHIIADNSTDQQCRKDIAALCKRLGVLYVSIPDHSYASNDSHAVAMHWVYKNVIRKRNAPYFGFLDHDIFPTKPCSVLQQITNGVYGRVTPPYGLSGEVVPVSSTQPYWSLWAGFCFMDAALLSGADVYQLNFFVKTTPKGQLDTGGGLWDSVMSKIPFPGELANVSYARFRTSTDSNIHTDYYECLDDWIHIGNLSNWYPTPAFDEKVDYFNKLLLRLSDQHDA